MVGDIKTILLANESTIKGGALQNLTNVRGGARTYF